MPYHHLSLEAASRSRQQDYELQKTLQKTDQRRDANNIINIIWATRTVKS